MFYSVASPDWKPGQPLTPAGALLFRTRFEAESFAPESATVAVAVRFDEAKRVVRPQGPVASASVGPWSSSAVSNTLGGVTVFGAIPPALVRPLLESETMVDWRPKAPVEPEPKFGGWDSLTMALMA